MTQSEQDEGMRGLMRDFIAGQIITTTALILRSALRCNRLQRPDLRDVLLLATEDRILAGLLDTLQVLCQQSRQNPLEILTQHAGNIRAVVAERSLKIHWLNDIQPDQLTQAQMLASKRLVERPELEPDRSRNIIDELILRTLRDYV